MSFDSRVYFAAVPGDLESKWEAALREAGMPMTVLLPTDWEEEGYVYLLDKPDDKAEDGFLIEAGLLDPAALDEDDLLPDERAMLSGAKYSAFVTTRLGAGNVALIIAGSLARATNGILVEYQGAAFQKAFEPDVVPFRGPRGPEGAPTLAERGFYDAALAWAIAKASGAHEEREKAESLAPPPPPPPEKSRRTWLYVVLGLIALGGISKLVRREKEDRKK